MSGKGLGLAAMIARPAAPEKRAVEEEEKRAIGPQHESVAAAVVPEPKVYDEQEDSAVSTSGETSPANRVTRSSSPRSPATLLPQPRKPGRPPKKGGIKKRTINLSPPIDAYLEEVWRTYRNPQGNYVNGVSGFIEGIIEEYRRKHPVRD